MATRTTTDRDREERFGEIVFSYLQSAERGEPTDRRQLLSQHPEFAAELEQFLGDIDGVGQLATPLRALVNPAHAGSSLSLHPSSFPDGTLGDYCLIREVGRGGMGVVYEAEQISLRRRVALKVLPWAAAMDPKQLQRFKNEALAAASLKHDHIVSVYAVGCERGVHYYAMEFIEGQTLAQVIGASRERETPEDLTSDFPPVADAPGALAADTAPVAALTTERSGPRGRKFHRRAAELIAGAAERAEHAHALGIVHRDIKPGNFLLDANGKIYVSDFGLARFGPDAGLTMSGDLVGTLRYMAPEQALARHGLADHRVDVYGLGCTLYELLTGSPAVEGQDKADIVRRIAFEEPVGLRKLDKAIPAELETMTLKCLAKNPNERYATAKEMADDLRHWLNDKPIKAKPPGWREKASKWGRRHRAFVQTSIAMLAFAVIGLGVSTWLVWREKQTAAQRDAETEAVLDFVENRILAAARPKDYQGGLGHDVSLRRALEAALPFVATSFTDQPLIEARLRRILGISFDSLGDNKISSEQLQRVRAIFTEHLGPDHPDTLRSMHNVSISYLALGQYADARKLFEETVALRKIKLGVDHRQTLASMSGLVTTYLTLGQHADALKLCEETLALQKAKLGPDDPDTFRTMANLATIYSAMGRHTDALKLEEETLAFRKAKLGPHHLDTLQSMRGLVQCYLRLHRTADAQKLCEETLALMKANLGPDHAITLETMHPMAECYCALGRYADALKLYEEALPLLKRKLGSEHPHTHRAMQNLAACYTDLQRHADALKLNEELVALTKAKEGPEHPTTVPIMLNLAHSYSGLGRHADALKLQEQALALSKTKLGPGHSYTFASTNELAWQLANCVDTKLRDSGRAVELAKKAVAGNPNDWNFWNTLGAAYYRAGDSKAAINALEKSIQLAANGGPSLDWFFLAMAHWQLGDKDRARTSYDQGVLGMEKSVSEKEILRRLRAEAAELLNVKSGDTDRK